jgi:3-hydroxymyristoyl/3-hydroxydecanoyl-(acyl carrier protein) dehydratase
LTFSHRFEAGVPSGSPCLDGHFMGNPIVPGAMLLGIAATVLAKRGAEITKVQRMKFLRPLLPDVPYEIDVTETAIVWRNDDGVIAQARVTLRPNER